MHRIVSFLLALAVCAFAHAAPPPVPPGSVTIQLGAGQVPSDVKVTKRKGATSKQVLVTVNPDWPVTILEHMTMHGGLPVDMVDVPTFAKGSTEFRIKPATLDTAPSSEGAFRTECPKPVKLAFDDSLVYPKKPGESHLHPFFGNDGSDAFSTAESLRTTGGSTCHGGIANRSSYWFAGLKDTRTDKPIVPDTLVVYYKPGVFSVTKGYGWAGADGVWHEVTITDPATGRPARKFPGFSDLPPGLAMIAGNPSRSTPRVSADAFDFRWSCITPKGTTSQTSEIPIDCPVTSPVPSYIIQEVMFPPCWDGKNTDSPDHKSHMSYVVQVKNEGDPRGWSHYECPSTHPVVIPAITFNAHYLVTPDMLPINWRLVSDTYKGPSGYSSHGDWRNGWGIDPADPEKKRTISSVWIRNCFEALRDCHADLLGDGRMLY